MAFGVTKDGFIPKTLDILDAEIEATIKSVFGDEADTGPQDPLGQLKGIFAEREALLWELAQFVYNSQYPNSAKDLSLDLVAQITGIVRKKATNSKIAAQYLIGTNGTVVPAGTIFSVDGNQLSRFVTDEEVTLGAGADEVQDITFSQVPTVGTWTLTLNGATTSALNFDADATAVQTAINALSTVFGGVTVSGNYTLGFTVTFSGADGKQPIALMTSGDAGGFDATITVTETTPGVTQAEVSMTAEDAGSSFTANARTLTIVETSVTGLDFTHNPAAATVGDDLETDAELRVRRERSLGTNSAGTLPALRTAVLEIEDVESAFVIENDSDVTVAGRPPHSFEVVAEQVDGATDPAVDQQIAQAIFDSKPAGIEAFGQIPTAGSDPAANEEDVTIGPPSHPSPVDGVYRVVTDSQGIDHVIGFSRPQLVDIYVEIDLVTNSKFPSNGLQAVQDAIFDFGEGLGIGVDVIVRPDLIAVLDSIDGIEDVKVRIGTSDNPPIGQDNNIPIDDGTNSVVQRSNWTKGDGTAETLPPTDPDSRIFITEL